MATKAVPNEVTYEELQSDLTTLTEGKDIQTEVGHADHHGVGYPAYGPFSIQSTDFWYLVAFVIFVVALGRPLLKALNGFLDQRADKISTQLDEARALREEAQELLTTYKRRQRDALEEADNMIQRAKDESKSLKADARKDLDKAVKSRELQAAAKIKLAESEAIAEVQTVAADIAMRAARELVLEMLNDKEQDAIIADAIKSLPSKKAA